jgi:hypothetical protein
MRDDSEPPRDVLALEPGEVVLWESKPQLRWVALSESFLLVFGTLLTGGPLAMAAAMALALPPTSLPELVLPSGAFLLMALACSAYLFGRFAWLLQQARRTVFRITTRRLVCTTPAVWHYEHQALAVSALGGWKIERGRRWGTRGTVTLHELTGGEYAAHIGLVGVRDPEAALHALQMLQRGELPAIR